MKTLSSIIVASAVACSGFAQDAIKLQNGSGAMAATAVYKMYEANSLAMEKYEGKRKAIFGAVKNVGRDVRGMPYVSLDCGPSALFAVQCFFPKEAAAQLAEVLPGRRVIIEGKLRGKLMNVIFEDCVFTK